MLVSLIGFEFSFSKRRWFSAKFQNANIKVAVRLGDIGNRSSKFLLRCRYLQFKSVPFFFTSKRKTKLLEFIYFNFCTRKLNIEPNEALTRDATHTFYPVNAHCQLPSTFSTKIWKFAKKNCVETVPVMKIFLIANQSAELHASSNDFPTNWNTLL